MMGKIYAEGIVETDISLEQQIRWHLKANHYPPVHESFVDVAIQAIHAVNACEGNTIIKMPNGIEKSAYGIVDGLHLDTWCYPSEEDF